MTAKFQGAWPALLTPLNEHDQINFTVLNALSDYLLSQGSDGLYLCGSTGQGVSMSVAERKQVAEAVIEQVDGRVPIIVHIGAIASVDAVELAQHARQIGADGISSIIPPLYNDLESTFAYFSALADAVPDLPLFPYLIGLSQDPVSLMRRLMEIPSVAGTKYTAPNMYELRQIVEMGAGGGEATRPFGWSVFSGMDEQCIFAAMFGSSGNIGSTLNVMPRIYGKIHASYQAGDVAQAKAYQLRANRITETLIAFGFPGALREASAFLGYPCGLPRLPWLPLGEDARHALHSQLEAVGFFEINDL